MLYSRNFSNYIEKISISRKIHQLCPLGSCFMCTHFYFFINIFLFAEDRKNVKQTVYSTKEVSQGFSCRIFARGIIVPLTLWAPSDIWVYVWWSSCTRSKANVKLKHYNSQFCKYFCQDTRVLNLAFVFWRKPSVAPPRIQ